MMRPQGQGPAPEYAIQPVPNIPGRKIIEKKHFDNTTCFLSASRTLAFQALTEQNVHDSEKDVI